MHEVTPKAVAIAVSTVMRMLFKVNRLRLGFGGLWGLGMPSPLLLLLSDTAVSLPCFCSRFLRRFRFPFGSAKIRHKNGRMRLMVTYSDLW